MAEHRVITDATIVSAALVSGPDGQIHVSIIIRDNATGEIIEVTDTGSSVTASLQLATRPDRPGLRRL